MKRDDITNERIIEILQNKAGNMSKTAKAIGVARSTLYKWVDDDKELTEALDDCFESMIDMAESKLAKNIKKGKEASIFFFLKTRGKERGYVERHEWAEHVEQPMFGDDENDDDGTFEE